MIDIAKLTFENIEITEKDVKATANFDLHEAETNAIYVNFRIPMSIPVTSPIGDLRPQAIEKFRDLCHNFVDIPDDQIGD